MLSSRAADAVRGVEVSAYTIPTDAPESDGTLEWTSTTLVLVEVAAGDEVGVGWSYTAAAATNLVHEVLEPVVRGASALDVQRLNLAMRVALRNVGATGLGAAGVSAVDIALWDLKAKLLGIPVVVAIGAVRDGVVVYGSGGFCSYSDKRLQEQLAGWRSDGITRAKIKVGRQPDRDPKRVQVARDAIGDGELYVDANGAFSAEQALRLADQFAEQDVTWFEEPVSSRDLAGLRLLRERLPDGMELAAGEYAWTAADFRELLGAVHCLQADATRCGGITGLLTAAALAETYELDLSGHTAPTIHAHALCAPATARHLEWFHDHVRIERMLFDGFLEPVAGCVSPDRSRIGLGVEFRHADAAEYRVA
jgi:L-alanine-DL-glutamate epimerase-like enolase superfamily enzyme